MNILPSVRNTVQDNLFPFFEEIPEPLSEKKQQFIQAVTLMNPQKHMSNYKRKGNGRKPGDRVSLLKAFIAKAVYNTGTTEMLIENLHNYKNLRRLCGWEYSFQVPSASTFSRVFGQFSEDKPAVKIHEAMIEEYCGTRLAGHVSRDPAEIGAREKPAKKEHNDTRPKRKRGRPEKGEAVQPGPLKRLEIQPLRTPEENLADLPEVCDVGTEKDSKGHRTSWNGYKLHIDTIDGDIPVSAVLTSASLHDSRVAVPPAQMTAQRIVNLYDLTD